MEDDWPPVETCRQNQTGLITRYVLCRFPWEYEGNEDVWFNLYGPPGSVNVATMRKELLMAKTFLHQVRTTRGYGVTCLFPMHDSTFSPIMEMPFLHSYVHEALPIALAHISQKTGQDYQVVKVENAVVIGSNMMVFLTFDAKECVGDSVPKTFYSMVSLRNGVVRECLLKPDHDADWGANEDKVLVTYDLWNPKFARCY